MSNTNYSDHLNWIWIPNGSFLRLAVQFCWPDLRLSYWCRLDFPWGSPEGAKCVGKTTLTASEKAMLLLNLIKLMDDWSQRLWLCVILSYFNYLLFMLIKGNFYVRRFGGLTLFACWQCPIRASQSCLPNLMGGLRKGKKWNISTNQCRIKDYSMNFNT